MDIIIYARLFMHSLHTEQFHFEAECKVHSQKGECREANTLMDLRNYYVIDMDRGEHSRSRITMEKLRCYARGRSLRILRVCVESGRRWAEPSY